MKELSFVTSNDGKVRGIVPVLAHYGFTVVRVIPDGMPEIQADSSAEVAVVKARWAFERHQRPVIVNDTAFHVPALGGWPGPTLQYSTGTLGYRVFRVILESLPIERRAGYLASSIAYFDGKMENPVVFTRLAHGRLLCDPRGTPSHPSFFMMRLLIPEGWDKTVAEMNEEEFARYRQETSLDEVYHQLGTWLEQHFAGLKTA